MAEVEKTSHLDRYGYKSMGSVETSPGNELSWAQGGALSKLGFSRRLDIYHNGNLIKKMGYLKPFGSFKAEIDGRMVEIHQKTVVKSGWKNARFRIIVDGEQVSEFFLSKQSSQGP